MSIVAPEAEESKSSRFGPPTSLTMRCENARHSADMAAAPKRAASPHTLDCHTLAESKSALPPVRSTYGRAASRGANPWRWCMPCVVSSPA